LLDTAFPGAPLDDVGLEQAAGLSDRLAGEEIEVVMTSDILRARQTGEPLARALGVPVITHPGVREIQAGDWELDDEWGPYIDVLVSWRTDPTRSMPHGDSGVSFMARFDAAIDELSDYGCAAVVSHGAALRTWLSVRGDVTVHDDWVLGNTDTVVVEGARQTWKILSWAGRQITR